MDKNQEEAIRALLSPFVDAGTQLSLRPEGEGFVVAGTRRFQKFTFLLHTDADGSLIVEKKKGPASLASFLSSGAFADLDRLARSMLPFLDERLRKARKIVEGNVREMAGIEGDEGPVWQAVEGVSRHLYQQRDQGTAVTFVHGDAGAGKSWLLMDLARKQAHEFLTRRRKDFPLYVDAQGVNLRSISQQIAHQMDVYNGVLRYNEVVPLVRLGALGLIVDGFDELIMPSGYNDTSRALMSYVEEFRGEGAIVASARTSFLHAYSVDSPKRDSAFPYVVTYLKLCPWEANDRALYSEIQERADLAPRLEALVSAAEVNRELLGRPFLVAETFARLAAGGDIAPQNLLATVEEAFSERERTEKLRDGDTNSPLLSKEQFSELLEEIAEEMWLLRQNSLDRQTARTVAGLVCESFGLGRSERELLEQRIDSHSFLEAESGGRTRFPHEIFFSRVLARRILRRLQEGDRPRLEALLRIAPLKVSMAEQLVSLVAPEGRPSDSAEVAFKACVLVGAQASRADRESNVRLNLGTMVSELLPFRNSDQPAEVVKLHFSGVAFRGSGVAGVSFVECFLEDVDVRGADWSNVSFRSCHPIGRLTIVDGQAMPPSLPDVSRLDVVRPNGSIETIYGTRPTRQRLFKAAAAPAPELPPISEKAGGVLEVVRGICTKVQQGYHWVPLNDNLDVHYKNLRRHAEWQEAIRVLEQHDFLYRERRSRKGPDAELAHVRRSGEILAALGGDRHAPDVKRLLDEIRAMRDPL